MRFSLFSLFLALNMSSAATLTVTNISDSGAGSLRQAIADALPGDTITFQLPTPSVISLTSGELLIDKNLTIVGPGWKNLTLSAGGHFSLDRVFEIAAGSLNVTITDLTISRGGFVEGSDLLNSSTGDVNILRCVIRDGLGFLGGGVSNEGALTLTDCAITRNSAADLGSIGGGIYNGGTITISRCTISHNETDAIGGGGPAIEGAGVLNNGTLTMINSTVFNNRCTIKGFGGGIANEPGRSLTITSCTIAYNSALADVDQSGAGIFIATPSKAANVHLKNCLVAANKQVSIETDIVGPFTSDGYNLVGSNDGASFTPAATDQVGTAAAPIDPVLGLLAQNGGPTETARFFPAARRSTRGIPLA